MNSTEIPTLSFFLQKVEVKLDQLWSDDIEVTGVTCGENVKVQCIASLAMLTNLQLYRIERSSENCFKLMAQLRCSW